MLERLQQGFRAAKNRLLGDQITDAAIEEAIRDIRLALLEADVDFNVVRSFLDRVRARAGTEVVAGTAKLEVKGKVEEVTPYHRFIAICQEELEKLMGGGADGTVDFAFAPLGVTAVMMVGL